METIYQCEDCLRYVVPDMAADCFVLLAPQPVLRGLPEMCACGLRDCQTIAQEIAAADQRRLTADSKPVADFWRRKRDLRDSKRKVESGKAGNPCGRQSRRAGAHAVTRPAIEGECHRGMPPEREVESPESSVPSPQSVGSSQAEFHSTVDVRAADDLLLNYFIRHYGEWIPLVMLMEVSRSITVHSRIPEVRVLLPENQDIDQQNRIYAPTGKAHSHYRLCLKSESVRLKRKAERDERQGEFETTNVNSGSHR